MFDPILYLSLILGLGGVYVLISSFENDDDDNERFYPLLKDPQTWNRTMITFALGYDITSYAKLKFEYYILDEETGDKSVKDNQMLVQLKFNF